MTIADTDITALKEKISLLIDQVFINEEFPFYGAEFIIDGTYMVKIYATLEEGEEKSGMIKVSLKSI